MIDNINILPLGGINEVGKNCLLMEYKDESIIIDCGLKFSTKESYNINSEIPDFSYLKKRHQKIKGIFITHGHLDHIGAVPYLPKEIKCPIYTTPFSAALINKKFHHQKIQIIKPNVSIKVGKAFTIHPLSTEHSIIESLSYFIETPVGNIYHTGDFRINNPKDLEAIKKKTHKKVLALLADSTNATTKGSTIKNEEIVKELKKIIKKKQRIILTIFSSQIDRIQHIIEICASERKKVFVVGKTLIDNITLWEKLNKNPALEKTVRPIHDLRKYNPENTLLLCTGSQGEPGSTLVKISTNRHRQLQIKKNDLIVFSSSVIPGNERQFNELLNLLAYFDVDIITGKDMAIHNSGHGYREELKLMLETVVPKYFFPVHGEHRHLIEHRKIAIETGISEKNIFLLENGSRFKISQNSVERVEKIHFKSIYYERNGAHPLPESLLAERELIAGKGVLSVLITLKRQRLHIIDAISKGNGFGEMRERQDFMKGLVSFLKKLCVESSVLLQEESSIKKHLKEKIDRFYYNKKTTSPDILIHFVSI